MATTHAHMDQRGRTVSDKVAATYHPNKCPAELLVDFDSLNCRLPHGHAGMHLDHGEEDFYWAAIK